MGCCTVHCLCPRGTYPREGQILVADRVVGAVVVDTVLSDLYLYLSLSVGVHRQVLASPKTSTPWPRP